MNMARRWLSLGHVHPQSKQREIMLDSGAFSAWSKGAEANLDDVMRSYDELIERYAPFYKDFWLINLDKIPGQRGRTATPQEIKEAVKVSDENFAILTKRYGPRVLPVFHQDESEDRLREVVQQNPGYVCISPRNDVAEHSRREWSQRAHEISGETWTHGLAATGARMMTQVPWRSVDSAAWVQMAAYGGILLCVGEKMFVTNVSGVSNNRRDLNGHADNFPPPKRDAMLEALRKAGVTEEDVRLNYSARAFVNMFYFDDFVRRNNRFKGANVQQTLFTL